MMSEGGTESWQISNYALVADGSIYDIWNESLEEISEAFLLWSQIAKEHKANEVKVWGNALANSMTLVSEATTVFLAGIVLDNTLPIGSQQQSANANCVAQISCTHSEMRWSHIVESLDTHMPDETSFVQFVDKVMTFLSNHGLIAKEVDWSCELSVALTKVKIDADARLQLVEIARQLASISSDLPQCASDAIEDWKAKKVMGTHDTSFLMSAIQVQEIVSNLNGKAALEVGSLPSGLIEVSVLPEKDKEPEFEVACSTSAAAVLPMVICAERTFCQIDQLLRQSLQHAFDDLALSLCLQQINGWPAEIENMEAQSVSALVKPFINKNAQDLIKTALKVFTGNRRAPEWPCDGLHTLLQSLVENVLHEDLGFLGTHVCVANVVAPLLTDLRAVEVGLVVWIGISKAAHTLAFISSRCGDDMDMIRANDVKEEVEFAMNLLRSLLNRLKPLAASMKDHSALTDDKLALPANACIAWVDKSEATFKILASKAMGNLLQSTATLAALVRKATPSWCHIVTDIKVCAAQAKKNLLGWPSRKILNEKSGSLFKLLSTCARLHTQWALEPQIDVHKEHGPMYNEADGLYQAGYKAIMIIAGCNVLYEKSGDDQFGAAEKLMVRQGLLPGGMVKALQAIVDVGNAKAKPKKSIATKLTAKAEVSS